MYNTQISNRVLEESKRKPPHSPPSKPKRKQQTRLRPVVKPAKRGFTAQIDADKKYKKNSSIFWTDSVSGLTVDVG